MTKKEIIKFFAALSWSRITHRYPNKTNKYPTKLGGYANKINNLTPQPMKPPFNCENTGCSYPNCVCGKNLSNTVILSGEPQPQQSKSAEEATSKLKSIKLCLEAHPDNEPNSEFEDRIDDLDWLIQFTLQTTAKDKEFCEALERMKANSFSREEIERIQSSVYEITGKGEVMKLFNSLLGVAAG